MDHMRGATAPPVVIITDLAYLSDDSVALTMLLKRKSLDFKGIITTAGNVSAAQSTIDLRRLLDDLGLAVPIVEGPSMAWHRQRHRYFAEVERLRLSGKVYAGALATSVQAELDSATAAQEAGSDTADMRSADFLIATAAANPGRLVIVLLGPATVIAQALSRKPFALQNVSRVLAMGGSLAVAGNVTPYAEFNVWFDPEAMEQLLASDIDLTLLPLDTTATVGYPSELAQELAGSDAALRNVKQYLERRGFPDRRVETWDEVLAAILIDPTLVARTEDQVLAASVDHAPEYGRILTLSPSNSGTRRPAHVILAVDAPRVRNVIAQSLVQLRQ